MRDFEWNAYMPNCHTLRLEPADGWQEDAARLLSGKTELTPVSYTHLFCMAGASIALTSAFQALGKSLYSMIISIIRQLVFLVPLAYILARYGAGIGNNDLVWWSYPIAEIAALTVSLLFFRHMYKTLIAKLPDHGPAISE